MDDVLKQGQEADPGNKDIQKARDDLKELEEAHKGGNPEEIEDKFNDSMDAQMNFGEEDEQASGSLEKITGQPLPPLE